MESREWSVVRSRRVHRWLRRHPEAVEHYRRAVEILRADPYAGEPLRGRCQGLWRLRVGRIRLVYRVLGEERMVVVEAVGYRESVYDELGC